MDEASEMPRHKPRRPLAAALFRALPCLARALGRRRILGWLVDADRVIRRAAHEEAGVLYGERYHNETMGLDTEQLRWLVQGRRVLDVGCGTGRWTRVAAEHASEVVGVDHNPAAIAAARRDAPANATFHVGDATEDRGSFDVALLVHVLEHVDDPVGLLASLRGRVSQVVVEVPDLLADPLNYVRLDLGRPFHTDDDHVREYTRDSLMAHLTAAGWDAHIDRCGANLVAVAD